MLRKYDRSIINKKNLRKIKSEHYNIVLFIDYIWRVPILERKNKKEENDVANKIKRSNKIG